MDPLLSVIIPAYNEEQTLTGILDQVFGVDLGEGGIEVLVVDDHSTDGTWEAASRYGDMHRDRTLRLFRQERNLGKGAAIRRGIDEAGGEVIVIQDADLEYDPREYSRLLQPIREGKADVVYGSRFMGSHPHRILFFWHSVGNRLLTGLSNMVNNLNLTDMETGYKMFRSDILKKIYLRENRFGFEPEVTCKIARVPGIRIYEVGISYYGRTYDDGKKIDWKDGFRAIYCILKYRFFRKRVFR